VETIEIGTYDNPTWKLSFHGFKRHDGRSISFSTILSEWHKFKYGMVLCADDMKGQVLFFYGEELRFASI
jgi:putative hemolysin